VVRRDGTVDEMSDNDADAARLGRLNGIKLRALVAEHLGLGTTASIGEPADFPPGAALIHDGAAWILLADQPGRRLGAALTWALRRGVGRVAIVAEEQTGMLARRAEAFDLDIDVWHADGRRLLPAVAEPLPDAAAAGAGHEVFRARIVEGGAEPVVEHGVLAGEVRGLEVCRVVDDESPATTRLDVGIGAHDREAFQMLHGDVPTVESLARIVEAVAAHRRVDAPHHPLNRLAAERFLRWRLIEDPGLVGMASLAPVAPPVPRANLKDPAPCVAAGTDADGVPTVVVCSWGVDLELVPFAADARRAVEERTGVPHRLVLSMPTRDRMRVTDDLAARLHRPADIATV